MLSKNQGGPSGLPQQVRVRETMSPPESEQSSKPSDIDRFCLHGFKTVGRPSKFGKSPRCTNEHDASSLPSLPSDPADDITLWTGRGKRKLFNFVNETKYKANTMLTMTQATMCPETSRSLNRLTNPARRPSCKPI
jgi:hypothetical protein